MPRGRLWFDPAGGEGCHDDRMDLQEILAEVYGPGVEISDLRRDSGGASRLTSAFVAVTGEGERHPLILRQSTPGQAAASCPLPQEAALMRAAKAAGAPVPQVIADGADFIVMSRIEGETIPRRILRSDALAAIRPELAGQCGEILAAIHRIPPEAVPALNGDDQLDAWAGILDLLGEPHPALELALRRLSLDRPGRSRTTVVHGDFRNGNLIIGPAGIRAVLDWELAHLGDPLEDLGWLCGKSWRFGSPLPVGGFGPYEQLISAYEQASGHPVDRAALHWWEMFGVLKWGIICVMQAQRHLSGAERSVELAALGRRVAETEWDLLRMLPEA
jgi:aminoglycoside phosphotransferase (APT) family kinase protein